MYRFVIVLAVLALSVAPAGLAQAQLGGPNVPTPLTEPPPPPPVDNDLGDDGLSSLQQILIFAAAGLVLAVIAFVIVRDARRSAPTDERPGTSSKGGPASGSGAKRTGKGAAAATASATDTSAGAIRARERQQAKRAKAKAKAVREQRKRNRPR